MFNESPLCVVDVGNTRTKFCVWFHCKETFDRELVSDLTETDERFVLPDLDFIDNTESYEEFAAWISVSPIKDFTKIQWLVSSVNVKKTNALCSQIKNLRPNDIVKILSLPDVPIAVKYDYPSKLGIDRAIAAFAGLLIVGKNAPFLVVDVGTAATIDFVDATGVFRGGAILPGPRLTAEALRARTASLPLIEDPENQKYDPCEWELWDKALTYPATETQNAIRLGVVFSLIGAISVFFWKTYKKVRKESGVPSSFSIILSGGSSELTVHYLNLYFDEIESNLGKMIPRPVVINEPRLVPYGLFAIARRGDVFKR